MRARDRNLENEATTKGLKTAWEQSRGRMLWEERNVQIKLLEWGKLFNVRR